MIESANKLRSRKVCVPITSLILFCANSTFEPNLLYEDTNENLWCMMKNLEKQKSKMLLFWIHCMCTFTPSKVVGCHKSLKNCVPQ